MAQPTMRAIGVSAFASPAKWEHLTLPIPSITGDEDILVRVKSVALGPGDPARAAGYSRIIETIKLPLTIGLDFAGTIAAVGSSITAFRSGDRVFGFTMAGGAAAEYVLLKPHRMLSIAKIPDELSFQDACYFPSTAHTIIQSLNRAEAEIPGGLKGKTVFVPAGLSATGSFALQLLKPIFGAGKVITTVSTAKVPRVVELLGEDKVDQIIDYTTQNVVKEIGRQTVDFMLDTSFTAMSCLPVMKPDTGVIFTLTGKSGKAFKDDWPAVPWLLEKVMDVVDSLYTWRVARWRVKYKAMQITMQLPDLEKVVEWSQSGKVKAVVGETAELEDLERVRALGAVVAKGKGGVGKYVILFE